MEDAEANSLILRALDGENVLVVCATAEAADHVSNQILSELASSTMTTALHGRSSVSVYLSLRQLLTFVTASRSVRERRVDFVFLDGVPAGMRHTTDAYVTSVLSAASRWQFLRL